MIGTNLQLQMSDCNTTFIAKPDVAHVRLDRRTIRFFRRKKMVRGDCNEPSVVIGRLQHYLYCNGQHWTAIRGSIQLHPTASEAVVLFALSAGRRVGSAYNNSAQKKNSGETSTVESKLSRSTVGIG